LFSCMSEPDDSQHGSPHGEETKPSTEHINLKVLDQEGNEVFFKIKKQTPLRKLMEAYCQRQGISLNSIRFLYDGQRLQAEQTPKSLEMDDNDIIDAVLSQTGGHFFL